jgi:uncharacterized RDD family membrane protein YckC
MDALFVAGKLTPESHVWADGMPEPRPAASLFAGGLTLSLTGLDRAGLIAPWSRSYARWIDTVLFQIPLLPVIDRLFKFWHGAGESFADMADKSVLIIVYLLGQSGLLCLAFLIGMVLEALVMARFGTTPGKWLFRLTVRQSDGTRVPLSGLIRRNVGILFYGYGLCIPFLNLWCIWRSFGRAADGRRCRWDEAQLLTVKQQPISPLRRCLGFAVFLLSCWLVAEA